MFHRGKPRTHLNVLSLIYGPCVFVRKRLYIGHFTRSRGSPLPFLFISRDEKAIQIPFLQFNNVSLGILLERDNSFIVSSVKFISSRAQNVQYWQFFEVSRIVIYLRGLLSISLDETVILTCLYNAAMLYRGKLRTYLNVFFCLLYVVHVFSCLKSSILVIFEFARIAISVPFCLFLGTKRRSQCVFAMSRCAIKSNPRTEFNVSCL